MVRRAFAVALAGAFVLAPTPALASASAPAVSQPVVTDADDDAAAKFDRAEATYAQGRYDEAITLLRELERDYPDPILRYNLGRAYEGAGKTAAAIDAYERYLAAAPDATDRAAVEERIARLRTQLRPTVDPQPTPVVDDVPSQQRPAKPLVAPWVLAGIGGLGVIVGGTFGGVSRARRQAAVDAPIQADAAAHLGEARRFATAANVAFGVGGALAIAGVSWAVAALVQRRNARLR